MGIRRWLGTIEPFRLIGDCAAMTIIEEGDDAELSLRRKIVASDRRLTRWVARVLLVEVRRQQRERRVLGSPPAPLAANDPAISTPPSYPDDVRKAG
jgi:hypothetical protein